MNQIKYVIQNQESTVENLLGRRMREGRSPYVKYPKLLARRNSLIIKQNHDVDGWTWQDTDRLELRNISQTQGWPESEEKYFYKPSAGSGSYIYIVDSGLDTDILRDFKNSPRLEWVFPDPDNTCRPWTRTNADKADILNNWHGTAMASKAAGNEFGIAKSATVVIVRLPVRNVRRPGWYATIITFCNSLNAIMSDVLQKNRQGKFIVNMSFGNVFALTRKCSQVCTKLIL